MSEVPLAGGSGFAVYEVVDANPNLQETVQFPVFVGLANVTAPAAAQQTVSFAPVSTAAAASTTAPVPRFAASPVSSDCTVLNDCGANYFPHLSVLPNPVDLKAIAGGAMTSQPGYIAIDNSGGGLMPWTAIVNYTSGADWLTLDYASGVNNGSVRLWAKAQALAAGTYRANVTINAGSAGSAVIPVTLTVAAAPTPVTVTPPNPPAAPAVTVGQVVNAATVPADADCCGVARNTDGFEPCRKDRDGNARWASRCVDLHERQADQLPDAGGDAVEELRATGSDGGRKSERAIHGGPFTGLAFGIFRRRAQSGLRCERTGASGGGRERSADFRDRDSRKARLCR